MRLRLKQILLVAGEAVFKQLSQRMGSAYSGPWGSAFSVWKPEPVAGAEARVAVEADAVFLIAQSMMNGVA